MEGGHGGCVFCWCCAFCCCVRLSAVLLARCFKHYCVVLCARWWCLACGLRALVGCFVVMEMISQAGFGFSANFFTSSKAQSTGVWGPPPLSGRPRGSVRVRLARVSGVASTTRGRRARTEVAGRVASGLRCTSRAGARSPGGRRFEYPHLGSASSLQSSVALRATGTRDRCPQRRWSGRRSIPSDGGHGRQAVVLEALVVQGAG